MPSLSYGQIQDRINSPPIHLNRDFPVTSLDFRLDISEHHLGILPEDIIFFGIGKGEWENAGVAEVRFVYTGKALYDFSADPQIARDQCGMLAARTLAVILASDNDRLTFH